MYAPFRGHVPSGVMVFASPWSAGSWPLQDFPLQGHERSPLLRITVYLKFLLRFPFFSGFHPHPRPDG